MTFGVLNVPKWGGGGRGCMVLKNIEFSLTASLRKGSEYLGAREDEEEKEVES